MNIILDTDIGNDCDDAGALAVLYNLKKEYNINPLIIGSTTSYVEGAYTVQLINDYYNINCLIGQNNVKGWPREDVSDLYTQKLCKDVAYINKDNIYEYVSLMRKVYSDAKEKINLIIVGPFNSINIFLTSLADDISSLTGKELINLKTEHIYVMGGKFTDEEIVFGGSVITSEWNIKSDISAVQNFLKEVTAPITFVPFECGLYLTGENLKKNPLNPVYKCYEIYSNGTRYSWDPATVYYAITKDSNAFIESEKGIITVDDEGVTRYKPDVNGNHTYLICNKDNEFLKDLINKYLY